MKILVVDDEHSFGALLGHTLKRLGHKPVITMDPGDALALLDGDVDAVITDIDMPGMNGVELAERIRERNRDMPIAFCTGSAPDDRVVEAAAELGRVLPKVWTVADVRAVVDELRTRQRAQRPGRPGYAAQLYGEVASVRAATEPDPEPEPTPAPVARRPPRVRVVFKRWSQLARLCDDSRKGPVYATIPGRAELSPGQEVSISLALPDEITVRIAGEVHAVRAARPGVGPEIVIELAGLREDMAARLRSLAQASAPPLADPIGATVSASETGYLEVAPRRRTAAGTERQLARGSTRGLKVSELLRGNGQLRDQIEQLAQHLKGDDE